MLKTKTPNEDIILQTNIVNEDYSSDRDFYNQNLLNFTKNTVINDISDTEIYEYKPDNINEINFNIFFLHYVQDNELSDLKKYIESDFNKQYNITKAKFGLTDINGVEITKGFNNVYETRQANGLREEAVLSEKTLTRFEELKQKPYVVRDFIGESTLKKPIKSGIPIFYNSFTLPFWQSKDKWVNEPLLFSNKPYFYNSFLLMEIYDSTSAVSQNRIQSVPIFINDRYNITEKNESKNFHYERPCFKLNEGVDGFSFFFLRDYITNEFYVKYSFWDALNGKKISLLPSSNLDVNKKWLQDPDNFSQNNRYLKYVLDYQNKTYKIYEYNPITKEYDSERSNFDLYQLEFDTYYKNKVVPNEKPKNSKLILTTQEISNPLNFTIKNLYTSNFVNSASSLPILTDGEINNYQTFLNNKTKNFLKQFNGYINNLTSEVFGELNEKNVYIPVVNRNVKAYQIPIKSFIFKNVDTKTWTIRSMEFKDITVNLNSLVLKNTVYNQRQSLWNENPSYRVSEAITIVHGSQSNIGSGTDAGKFTENVLRKYLENPLIFKVLLNQIESERYNINYYQYDESYREQSIVNFLSKCFTKLGVVFRVTSSHNYDYTGLAVDLRGQVDQNHSEIYYYIDKLTQKYESMKSINRAIFDDIRDTALGLLIAYNTNQSDLFSIVDGVVDAVNDILNPKDNPELIEQFLILTAQKNINQTDKDILINKLTLEKAVINLDANPTDLRYEIRDYALTTYAVQNGDKFIIPNESNKIDVYFNIGEKLKFLASNISQFVINGKLRISIINSDGDIKNIVVPIKSTITAKKPSDAASKNKLPKYTAPKKPSGGGVAELDEML
jgi:hypothetical protein